MWFAVLALAVLLMVDIISHFRRIRKTEKIIRPGHRPYINSAKKRAREATCAYTGHQLWCPGCGCVFVLTEKSRLRNLETDDEWFHCIDCPQCGHEARFTSDDFFWARDIKGKSPEEIMDMRAERDRAKQAPAEEKPVLEEEEDPREVDQLEPEEEDEFSKAEGEQGCYTGEDESPEPPKKDEERHDLGGEGGTR